MNDVFVFIVTWCCPINNSIMWFYVLIPCCDVRYDVIGLSLTCFLCVCVCRTSDLVSPLRDTTNPKGLLWL